MKRLLPFMILGLTSTLAACMQGSSAPGTTSEVKPTPEAKPEADPLERIAALPTFEEVVAAVRPLMSDVHDATSPGTVALTAWAAKDSQLKWEHVGVEKDETSFALVQKDPDEERGKRYCASGRLIQINVDKTSFGKTYQGLLMDRGGKLWAFSAVGKTGSLVQQSWARFCGVVIGQYHYSNSGGGTGHAVQVVGMFDLPENKPAASAAGAR